MSVLSKKKETVEKLLEYFPKTFPEELRIDLASRKEKEILKWFLASLLLGARISSKIAIKTYKQFEIKGLITIDAIQKAGWNRLVEVLDEGGYARYDYKTADMLLDITKRLQDEYGGKLLNLLEKAVDSEELEGLLEEFKGVGPVTVNIFLRELREICPKANPPLQKFAIRAGFHLNLVTTKDPRNALKQLKEIWKNSGAKDRSFIYLESALIRFGKDFCTEDKCDLSILDNLVPNQ